MAYTPHQKAMIALARRLSRKDTPMVQRALLEAMAVESNFRHLNYGDRDSVGVLQQRPSQGWGPASETPTQDINQFLQRARRNSRGFHGTAGQLAQSVQRSAFPERYDQRLNQVNELLRGAVPKGTAGTLGKAPGGHSPVAKLAGESTQSMLAAQMLHQAQQTVGGQLGDPSSVMAMAMMRQQAEAAQQEYGDVGQPAPPHDEPGGHAGHAHGGGHVILAKGADRGGVTTGSGILGFAKQIAGIYGQPLKITTGTNHNQFVAGTRRESAHWQGNAADIAASGAQLTRMGRSALIAAGMPRAQAMKVKGGLFNIGGRQIIFNTNEGGNHFNHLHIGLRG